MSKQSIWARLKAKGFSDTACAAIMGNMQAESAFRSNNVEDRCSLSDEAYTEAVDNGSYSREQFMRDGGLAFGYGLCQWTYFTRKAGLYDFAKARGVSIADEQMQIDWLCEELNQGEYISVLQMLQSSVALYIMTRKFMCTYENPADQREKTIDYRVRLAQAIYDELAGTVTAPETEESAGEGQNAQNPQSGQESPSGTGAAECDGIPKAWPPRMTDRNCEGWPEIKLIQSALLCRGYNVLVDGIFGNSLLGKVRTFQKDQGLDPDGIVGNMTWKALLKLPEKW